MRETVTTLEREFFYSRTPLPKLYVDYLNYLRNIKNLEIGSIQNRKQPVLQFLVSHKSKSTPSQIKYITKKEVQEYTMNTAAPLTRNMKRALVIALRDFFRFIHLYEYSEDDLSKSVPTITTYRMASVPRGMPWETVEKILITVNTKIFSGKRDYALILMLARYGIRACQIRELRLNDIDWKNETIIFKAVKGGKEIKASLFPDVAEALIKYFKSGRKNASKEYDQVFLTSGTYGSISMGQVPLRDSTWNIVNRVLKKAGQQHLLAHARGPHAIRHAFATKLLDEDVPMKSISDLLGHRSLSTTFIYTKSSMPSMRKLTRMWPERN